MFVVEGTWWQVAATLNSSHVSKLMMDYVRTRFSPETIRAVDIGRHLHKDIFEDMVQGLVSHSPLLVTSRTSERTSLRVRSEPTALPSPSKEIGFWCSGLSPPPTIMTGKGLVRSASDEQG